MRYYYWKYREAKRKRAQQTPAELRFWDLVRKKKMEFRFIRQKPILRYFGDFYCSAKKLIVEIDGPSHNNKGEADSRRTRKLERLGLNVMRFKNEEVFNHPDDVLERLRRALAILPTHVFRRFKWRRSA